MAYGSAEIGATERALFDADVPFVAGKNYLVDAVNSGGEVRWDTNGDITDGTDQADSDGPTTYLYDNQDYLQSYPNATAATWYLNINLHGTNLGIIDTVIIKNHNLYSQGVSSVKVGFDQNQDGQFTAVDEAADVNPQTTGTDKRIVIPELFHTGSVARRYTDVQHLRLTIYDGTGTATPRIGELFVGRRRQLKTPPLNPFDKSAWSSDIRAFVSASGVRSQYSYHTKRAILDATFRVHEASYVSDWESFMEDDLDGGEQPFWWVWEPSSSPSDALWCDLQNHAMVGPSEGFSERLFSLSAVERGPNFLRTGNGR